LTFPVSQIHKTLSLVICTEKPILHKQVGFFIIFLKTFEMKFNTLLIQYRLFYQLRRINVMLVVFLLSLQQSFSQTLFQEKQNEINSITISGNDFLDEKDILDIFNTRQSPGKISKFFYNIFGEKFGNKAEYFLPDVLDADIDRLKQLYNDNGFFDVYISHNYLLNSDSTRTDISIDVRENLRTGIADIVYKGLEGIDTKILAQILLEPIVKKGDPYQKSKINEEAYRILDIIMNNGYPFARILSDSSSATRYYSTNKIKVNYTFNIQKQYKYGEIKINIIPYREDITENIIYKQLDFKKGDWISKNKISSSEKSLNKLGVFEAARVEVKHDSSNLVTDEIPVNIFVKPRNKHELAPEVLVSDEDNTFNLGIGAGYTNHNFFGDARRFNSRVRLSTKAIQEWNFRRIFGKGGLSDPTILGKVELQLQLTQPSLFIKTLNGLWTMSLTVDKKNYYVATIARNKIGLVNQYATYTTGYFDWILERSNVNWLEDTLITGLSSSRLKEEEKPQFNSIITFVLQRDKTDDIFSPTQGFFHALSLEESGTLQTLFRNIQPTLPFTQYYKATLLGRWYKDISRTKFNILAIKVQAGYEDKYGESKHNPNRLIPLTRRFFGGGSGSVRAWKTWTLGMMPDNEVQLGGNFMMEGNNELRVNHLRGLGKLWFLDLQNFWGVYFLDYGNVWSNIHEFRIKDIAVGAGIGIRYDTLLGPVRLDFGFRVYDPKEFLGKEWFFKKKFFKEVINSGVLNFGIGHAF
jgi:outer membrane protein insertion porin family